VLQAIQVTADNSGKSGPEELFQCLVVCWRIRLRRREMIYLSRQISQGPAAGSSKPRRFLAQRKLIGYLTEREETTTTDGGADLHDDSYALDRCSDSNDETTNFSKS